MDLSRHVNGGRFVAPMGGWARFQIFTKITAVLTRLIFRRRGLAHGLRGLAALLICRSNNAEPDF